MTDKSEKAIRRMLERQSKFWNDQFTFDSSEEVESQERRANENRQTRQTQNESPTIYKTTPENHECEVENTNFDADVGGTDLDEHGSFDWLVTTEDIMDSNILTKLLIPSDKIHIIGVGRSWLPIALYDAGFRSITCSDISDVVIRDMKALHCEQRPGIQWVVCDVLNMHNILTGQFDAVIDKCTSDTLQYRSRSKDSHVFLSVMFSEVYRTLNERGKYIVITPRRKLPALDTFILAKDETNPKQDLCVTKQLYDPLVSSVDPYNSHMTNDIIKQNLLLVDKVNEEIELGSKPPTQPVLWTIHPVREIYRPEGEALLTPAVKNGGHIPSKTRVKVYVHVREKGLGIEKHPETHAAIAQHHVLKTALARKLLASEWIRVGSNITNSFSCANYAPDTFPNSTFMVNIPFFLDPTTTKSAESSSVIHHPLVSVEFCHRSIFDDSEDIFEANVVNLPQEFVYLDEKSQKQNVEVNLLDAKIGQPVQNLFIPRLTITQTMMSRKMFPTISISSTNCIPQNKAWQRAILYSFYASQCRTSLSQVHAAFQGTKIDLDALQKYYSEVNYRQHAHKFQELCASPSSASYLHYKPSANSTEITANMLRKNIPLPLVSVRIRVLKKRRIGRGLLFAIVQDSEKCETKRLSPVLNTKEKKNKKRVSADVTSLTTANNVVKTTSIPLGVHEEMNKDKDKKEEGSFGQQNKKQKFLSSVNIECCENLLSMTQVLAPVTRDSVIAPTSIEYTAPTQLIISPNQFDLAAFACLNPSYFSEGTQGSSQSLIPKYPSVVLRSMQNHQIRSTGILGDMSVENTPPNLVDMWDNEGNLLLNADQELDEFNLFQSTIKTNEDIIVVGIPIKDTYDRISIVVTMIFFDDINIEECNKVIDSANSKDRGIKKAGMSQDERIKLKAKKQQERAASKMKRIQLISDEKPQRFE